MTYKSIYDKYHSSRLEPAYNEVQEWKALGMLKRSRKKAQKNKQDNKTKVEEKRALKNPFNVIIRDIGQFLNEEETNKKKKKK